MPDGPTLLLFAGASLALLAVPGPAVIYLGFAVVKFAGAAYLVYLGVRKLLEREKPQETMSGGRSRLFLRDVLVHHLAAILATSHSRLSQS